MGRGSKKDTEQNAKSLDLLYQEIVAAILNYFQLLGGMSEQQEINFKAQKIRVIRQTGTINEGDRSTLINLMQHANLRSLEGVHKFLLNCRKAEIFGLTEPQKYNLRLYLDNCLDQMQNIR